MFLFGEVSEQPGIMRIYNGHRFEISIFNHRDDWAGWYQGSPEVPQDLVIPRVENADLKLMPHYRFFFLHTTTFYDQFKCIFAVYLAIYIVFKPHRSLPASLVTLTGPLCKQYYMTQSCAIFIAILKRSISKKSKKSK